MSEKTTGVGKTDIAPAHGGEVRLRGQSGQTMIEYALLLAMVMLGIMGVTGYFLSAIGSFYMNIAKVITLPFP